MTSILLAGHHQSIMQQRKSKLILNDFFSRNVTQIEVKPTAFQNI